MPMWPILLLACAAHDWRDAVRADTSAAYSAYALKNPGTFKAETAKRRAEARGWDEAVLADDSGGYRAFAEAFPTSRRAPEAMKLAEDRAWTEVSASEALSDWLTFLERYPSSPHAPEARARTEALFFAAAKAEGTEAAWVRFLSQYPTGGHTAAAWAERDRLAWDRAVAEATRTAYERYLADVPALKAPDGQVVAGVHRAEAEQWLASTYVRRIQPVVALVESVQPRKGTEAELKALAAVIDGGLLTELRRTFTVLPARTVDATYGMPPVQELVGVEPDVGILSIEVHEKVGRDFDPNGHATDLQVIVRLYVPPTPKPVVVREVNATTPDRVLAQKIDELHRSAVRALGEQLLRVGPEIASQAPKAAR